MSTSQSESCQCYACRYDQVRLGRAREGIGEMPGDMALYTAAQLLECQQYASFDISESDSEEEQEFWRALSPHLQPWLQSVVALDADVNVEIAAHAAWSLGRTVSDGWSTDPERAPRTAFSWAEVTGHDLFFDGIAVAGLIGGWTGREVIEAMMSFAGYLAGVGVIREADAPRLLEDLEVWAPRAVAHMDGDGPWFDRDGTSRTWDGDFVILNRPDGTVERYNPAERSERILRERAEAERKPNRAERRYLKAAGRKSSKSQPKKRVKRKKRPKRKQRTHARN